MMNECDLKVYLYIKYLLNTVINFNFQSNFKIMIKYILKVTKIYLRKFKIFPETSV